MATARGSFADIRTQAMTALARYAAQTDSPPKTSRANVVFRGLPYKLHRATIVKLLGNASIVGRALAYLNKAKKITDWLLGSNGYNLWPIMISTVASTTNRQPQRSQPPFRAAVLGQFSLP